MSEILGRIWRKRFTGRKRKKLKREMSNLRRGPVGYGGCEMGGRPDLNPSKGSTVSARKRKKKDEGGKITGGERKKKGLL